MRGGGLWSRIEQEKGNGNGRSEGGIVSCAAYSALNVWRASARACFAAALRCIGLGVAQAPINRAFERRDIDPVTAEALSAARASQMARGQARQAEGRRVAATHNFAATAAFRASWQVPNQLR